MMLSLNNLVFGLLLFTALSSCRIYSYPSFKLPSEKINSGQYENGAATNCYIKFIKGPLENYGSIDRITNDSIYLIKSLSFQNAHINQIKNQVPIDGIKYIKCDLILNKDSFLLSEEIRKNRYKNGDKTNYIVKLKNGKSKKFHSIKRFDNDSIYFNNWIYERQEGKLLAKVVYFQEPISFEDIEYIKYHNRMASAVSNSVIIIGTLGYGFWMISQDGLY